MTSLAFVFVSLLHKRVRFHVDVRLFSNRPQKTSKCGKNINHTLVCHFLQVVLTTFWRNGISLSTRWSVVISNHFNGEKWTDQHDGSAEQVPNRNRTHDVLSTRRVLYPLSHENSWRAMALNWVDTWQVSCVPPAVRRTHELVSCWSVHFSHSLTTLMVLPIFLCFSFYILGAWRTTSSKPFKIRISKKFCARLQTTSQRFTATKINPSKVTHISFQRAEGLHLNRGLQPV